MRPSYKSTKVISNLWRVTLLTSYLLETMLHIFCPLFLSSKFQILGLTPSNLMSFIQCVDKTIVTHISRFYEIPPCPWVLAGVQLALHVAYLGIPPLIIGHLQEVQNIIRIGGCVFCPSGARTGAFAGGCCCTNHWATEIRPLWPSHKTTNILSNL